MSGLMIVSALLTSSFVPNTKPTTKTFKYVGDIAPANYFDPLKICTGPNVKEQRLKYFREAEIQHSRLAMLGAVALPLIEYFKDDGLAINYLSEMDLNAQSPFWLGMFLYEYARMNKGWSNPFVPSGMPFTLKEKYQPGNVFQVNTDNVSEARYNRELSNGRLAMLACAHIIGSELATGTGLF
tara:strand:- start:61 stop:609 length:549 start_codon:yes stop_codon:yes gene_type:complete